MAGPESLELRVDLGLDPEADALELDDAALNLREELLELDVDAVERPVSGPPPEGAKAIETTLVGTLIVLAGKEAIAAAVQQVRQWLSRGKGRYVKLQLGEDTIEISDPSAEDQRRLLDTFLARHTAEA